MRQRVTRSGGFTLIEVLLALGLLGIGLLSLAAMQLTALQYNARGKHMTHASAIAEAQIEDLMRRRWTSLAPTSGWTTPVARVSEVDTAGGPVAEQSYDVSHRIADLDVGRSRSIDVMVQWDEPGRPGRQYGLSSIRFNHEGL